MSAMKIDIKDGDGKLINSTVILDGSGEPDPERVITENEKFYDEEIAPALAALSKRCHERGMAFGAIVEYNPNEEGRSIFSTEKVGLAMKLALLGIQSGGNIDKVIMHYDKACEDVGIDLSQQSIYMRAYRNYLKRIGV